MDSLCAVWVPHVECEVASGSYTAWRNENMTLGDAMGLLFTRWVGGISFISNAFFVCTASIQKGTMYSSPPI